MLASNLSCCTTFLIAGMLEEPDIALFLFGDTLGTIVGWMSRLTKAEMITSGFRSILICNNNIMTIGGARRKTVPVY